MRWYDRLWYRAPRYYAWPLLPLSRLYYLALTFRNYLYRFKPPQALSVPVVVVGNLSVGGTGKTPLVIHLLERFQARGIKVGVVSRGYGGSASVGAPIEVTNNTSPQLIGDEPKLIYQKTQCPVAIAKKLDEAARVLIDRHRVQLILSDDGLQHRGLARTIEIAAVDGSRGFGNRYLLPAGPLREPVSRIKDVNFVIINGDLKAKADEVVRAAKQHCYSMQLKPKSLYTPVYDRRYPVDHFAGQRVHACAALANPERFFDALESLGMLVIRHAFRDHHAYHAADFQFAERLPIVMTAKDGVKWLDIAEQGHKIAADVWILETQLQIDEDFERKLFTKLGYKYDG